MLQVATNNSNIKASKEQNKKLKGNLGGSNMKLQLALDDITLEDAVELLDKVHPYVDIIEVGSPFIIEEGMRPVRIFKEKYPDIPVYETTTIIHEGLDPVLRKAADLLATTPVFPITEDTGETGVMYTFEEKKKDIIIEKEEDGVWNVSGPRLERVFDINKLNTEEDFYLFANKMRYLGIDTALREAGCQDGDTVRLLGFEFEFIEN